MDTHVFLWWVTNNSALSESAVEAIQDPTNELLLSAVSGWEIAIKSTLGRLELSSSPVDFVPDQLRRNELGVLPVSMHHALEVYSLPPHHGDPFDRMLIAQSRSESAPLISGDSAFHPYDVEIIW